MTGRVYSPESQCKGKKRYTTKDEAKRQAKRAEAATGRMRPYRCAHCDSWHLGHKPTQPYDFSKGNT